MEDIKTPSTLILRLHQKWKSCRPQCIATPTPIPTGGLPTRYTTYLGAKSIATIPPLLHPAATIPSVLPPATKPPLSATNPRPPQTRCNHPLAIKAPLWKTHLCALWAFIILMYFIIIIMILCLIFHFYKFFFLFIY